MTPPLVTVPAVDSAAKATTGYLAVARSFKKITTDEEYAIVDAHCQAGLELKKKIEADFKESKSKAHDAWKAIVAQEKGHLDGIEEGRRVDKHLLDDRDQELKALRAAEEARLREVARIAAEDEALAKAERAAEFGDAAAADAIMAAPVVVAPVRLAADTPKRTTVLRTVWKARIIDPNKVPREYCVPNEKAINALASATKGAIKVEGVEFYQERI